MTSLPNAQTNPTMIISDQLKRALPDLRLVNVIFELPDVSNLPHSTHDSKAYIAHQVKVLEDYLQAAGVNRDNISQQGAIQAGRKAYRTLGKDPTKYRLSSEKLLRRILGPEGFPYFNALLDNTEMPVNTDRPVNAPSVPTSANNIDLVSRCQTLVDLSNVLSIRFMCPVGTVDLGKIVGQLVTVDVGAPGESFVNLASQDFNLQGLVVSRDDLGPFGSTTSDSQRTGITPQTSKVQLTLFLFDPLIDIDHLVTQVQAIIWGLCPTLADGLHIQIL